MLLWMLACDGGERLIKGDLDFRESSTFDSGVSTSSSSLPAWLSISDPNSLDAGGDGHWEPGETLTLQVILHNNWDDDYLWYPGVLVSSSDEGLQIPEPGGDWRYALFGHTEELMNIPVVADAAVGTTFHFQLEVTSLGCVNEQLHCVDPGPISYERTLE